MTHSDERAACTRRCWWMGGGIGLVLALLLWLAFGWTFWQSLFTGIVLAIIAGAALAYFMCAKIAATPASTRPAQPRNVASTGSGADTSGRVADQAAKPARDARASAPPATPPASSTSGSPTSGPSTSGASAPASTPAAAMSAVPAEAPEETIPKIDLPASGDDGAQEARTAEPAPDHSTDPVAGVEPAHSAEPSHAAEPTHAAESAPAVEPERGPERGNVATESEPELLSAPRAGQADDLRRINGIGPKLEQTLNELGVYHFDQIASWGRRELEWVDARLPFRGRIARDGWVEQARALAADGPDGASPGDRT